MTDWRDALSEEVRQLEAEASSPELTPRALALLRVLVPTTAIGAGLLYSRGGSD
jgi:hypothetical protein